MRRWLGLFPSSWLCWDFYSRRHPTGFRNYPVIGYIRALAERISPRGQQYFIEEAGEFALLDGHVPGPRQIAWKRVKPASFRPLV